MSDGDSNHEPDLPAGDFSSWLVEMRSALRGERAAEVPCNGCTACCTSSQFVHIEPDETATLARIPPELLFPAPARPAGHVLLGYDERGHCPMLVDDRCSIYEDRPRTCRTYDCRIFPATGLEFSEDEHKPLIAERARRWRFGLGTEADRASHAAVRAAARYLREHEDELPPDSVPRNTTQAAVLAVELSDRFAERPSVGQLGHGDAGVPTQERGPGDGLGAEPVADPVEGDVEVGPVPVAVERQR